MVFFRNFYNKFIYHFDDPVWNWGIRIALSIVVPILFGIVFNCQEEAVWIAVGAEASAFIEMRGDFAQRFRVALGAILLNIIFAILGGFLGNFWILGLIFMFLIGFTSGIFKNLGEKGAALALTVYISGIVNVSLPIKDWQALIDRTELFLIGGAWAGIVNITAVLLLKEGSPFRRSIADIWNAVAQLTAASGKGWDNKSKRESLRTLYLNEKTLRNAINSSISYFENTVDKIENKDSKQYKLAQSRKIAVLIGLHVIQLAEHIDVLDKSQIPYKSRLKIFSLYRAIEQISLRMAEYITNLKPEDRLVIELKCNRMKTLLTNLEKDGAESNYVQNFLPEINILINRIIKIFNRGVELLEQPNEKISLRSYTILETIAILHPRYLFENIKALFRTDSLTLKYALRVGGAASIAYIIQIFFFKENGYWIPLTAVIVSQPFVGATLKRGIERSIGTILGVLVGSIVLFVPIPTIAQVILVVASSIFTVYFLKSNYTLATFFITTLLIATLYLEHSFNIDLMNRRIIYTAIGSAIAIVAGFVLFPTFDKSLLPKYLAAALEANYIYFKKTFYNSPNQETWTVWKRNAEIKNSETFDSINRFIGETVVKRKKGYAQTYFFIVHNIRITRELNAYHTDVEFQEDLMPAHNKALFYQLLYEIDDLFRNILILGKKRGNHFIDKNIIEDYPTEGLKNLNPSEHQVLHLLKIANELKAIQAALLQNNIKENNVSNKNLAQVENLA